jgi:hypothetical protein
MSTSNNGKRRKPFFILGWCRGAFIVAFTLLAGGFSPISPAIVTATPSNNTSTTTLSSPGIELSSQPVYQEHVRDVNETLINQTHAHLIVEGNGTLTLPNGTETIRTTSTKSGIVSMMEGAFTGKEEILTTEDDDGSESATATVYEIVRFNFENGEGRGIVTVHVHTNSTGVLAPLNGMILAGIDELHPDGTGLLTLWEWQSGIPYLEMQAQPPMMMQESSINTTTTTTSEPSSTVMQ